MYPKYNFHKKYEIVRNNKIPVCLKINKNNIKNKND